MVPDADLHLNAQADRRLKKGHLWIYSNEVNIRQTPLKSLSPGQLVRVIAASGQCLGLAFVNPNALICGRLLTRDERPIDRRLLRQRVAQALALRERCFPTPHYRLLYGDSDFLPGVVIDRFGDVLVVQISVAGFDRLQEDLLAVLETLIAPRCVIVRNDHGARALEGLDAELAIHGEAPEWLNVQENGCRFQVPVTTGQKTGWFYDHRCNRQFLQPLCKGQRVLDVFSYAGGWGIQAAAAGADEVLCVDASEQALNMVAHNAGLNSVDKQVSVHKGKAIEVLKALQAAGEKFDVVVLDPPAFIRRRKDQKAGQAAYRHHNELALKLLQPEGLLVSASCSMLMSDELLLESVHGAARHLDRQVQLIYRGGQGPDHPVHPMIPETNYLKAQFFQSVR